MNPADMSRADRCRSYKSENLKIKEQVLGVRAIVDDSPEFWIKGEARVDGKESV